MQGVVNYLAPDLLILFVATQATMKALRTKTCVGDAALLNNALIDRPIRLGDHDK